MSQPPLLETKALTMKFGGVVANDRVDFRLEEMELRCIIGPNGAGKSTFFKMLTGQVKPTQGSVTFRETNITGASSHAIARLGVGIKTQVPSVFDGLSVLENIWLSASRKNTAKRAKRIVDEVVARVGIEAIGHRQVGQLAHGQRQWVEIGIVLAGEPSLILLDEPAAGMTHEEVLRTAALIREINRSQALIVVEHDMQFIRMIATTVTVFHQGKILMEDKMDRVVSNPVVRDVYLGKKAA